MLGYTTRVQGRAGDVCDSMVYRKVNSLCIRSYAIDNRSRKICSNNNVFSLLYCSLLYIRWVSAIYVLLLKRRTVFCKQQNSLLFKSLATSADKHSLYESPFLQVIVTTLSIEEKNLVYCRIFVLKMSNSENILTVF